MKYVLTLMWLVSGFAYGATCPNLPVGANALGYTAQLFYDEPQLAEVSVTDLDSTSKWYPGVFYNQVSRNLATRELLSSQNSELAIGLGGGITSETYGSQAGALPLLSGAEGFYVEFAMRLSSNDSDHFIGLFLQTAEHDLAHHDHLSTDPAGFERWTEIDVAESGYGLGSLASVVNWAGIYPHYDPKVVNDYAVEAPSPFDWTIEHRYGVSYDPVTNVLQYYIDDEPTLKVTPPRNSVIKQFHYYMVMNAGSHGSHLPYDMFVRYVRAYSK